MGIAMDVASDFRASPEAVRDARGFVATTLREWACEGLLDTATLLTSELVTNAIMHARTGPRVLLSLERGVLRIEVIDRGIGVPQARQPMPDAVSGRGLALVDAMATRWGVSTVSGGKAVWFELTSG